MTRAAAALISLVMLTSLGLGEAAQAQERAIIGDATMTEDRTIVVRLRRTADGINVSGIVKYRVNDPQYLEVLNHLGGMNPGDTKLVPAWDDAGPEKK